MEWHACHNLASRSGADPLEWAMVRCSGGYLLHRSRLAHSSRVYLVLADIGFDADTTGLDDKAARSAAVSSQDRLAAYAANMVLASWAAAYGTARSTLQVGRLAASCSRVQTSASGTQQPSA